MERRRGRSDGTSEVVEGKKKVLKRFIAAKD